MDLNQLSILVRVIDAKSFTKAARFLKQPKSRISRKIATLERELGVALLYRTTRRFHPTEAGMKLYQECRDHIYALEGASEFVQKHSLEVSGVLKLTAAEDMGTALLSPIIDEVTSLHPQLRIDAQLSNSFVDIVREGFDLAIRIGELEDTSLMAKRIGQTTSILVASPSYLENAPRIESAKDLTKHPTLDFNFEGSDENTWLLQSSAKREEKIKIKPLCRSSNPQVLVQLAIQGKGVALVPSFLCIDAIHSGKLKRVLPNHHDEPLTVSFVWPSQKELNPKVRAFIDVGMRMLTKYLF